MRNLRTLHTLHIELHGSEPSIWRRIEVDGSMTLARFHDVLQGALGWTNSHLHLYMDSNPFIRGGTETGQKPLTWLMANSIEEGLEGEDEAHITLSKALARSGSKLWYEYDLGDSWMHLITEESSRPLDPEAPEALVLDGALRVPLEDCGGLHGWYQMLEVMRKQPVDPERGEADQQYLIDWFTSHVGYFTPVDPEAFDAPEASMLIRLRLDGPPSSTAVGRWLLTMPPYLRVVLASALFRVGVDIFAPVTAAQMPAEAPRAMASMLWWINACSGEGLALTAAGYLPPATLREVIAGLGWEQDMAVQVGGKTEVNTHSILRFRAAMMDFGLLKAQGKKLVATPAGLRLAKNPDKLWAHLVKRAHNSVRDEHVYDTTMLALLVTAGSEVQDWQEFSGLITEGMRLIGYTRRDGSPLTEYSYSAVGERWYMITRAFRDEGLGVGNKGRAVALERAFALDVLRS